MTWGEINYFFYKIKREINYFFDKLSVKSKSDFAQCKTELALLLLEDLLGARHHNYSLECS